MADKSKTITDIEKQRDLMDSLTKLAAKLGVELDKHSKHAGAFLRDLTKIERINDDIHQTTRESITSYKDLMDDIKKQKITINSLQSEYNKKERERDEYAKKHGVIAAHSLSEKLVDLNNKLNSEKASLDTLKKQQSVIVGNINHSKIFLETEKKRLDILNRQLSLENLKRSHFEKMLGKIASPEVSKVLRLDKLPTSILLSLSAVITLTQKMFSVFVQLDNEMFSLRTHFGLFREDSGRIESMAKNAALNYAKLGVTVTMSSNAVKSLGDNFGLISTISQDIVDNISILNASLGVSEKTSADVLHTLSGISEKVLEDASKGMIGFTQQLSAAAGTNLNQVMSDIATASDSVRSTFRGSTLELIKTTVEARRMGLSLESIAKTSEGLLDFNSSVNAEMEASVLLGKNLNLNKARQLSWEGKIGEANKEVLRVVKSAGNFDKMNIMQKKALASAVGKSVEEIQKMLQREKEIDWIRKSGRKDLIDKLNNEEKLLKLTEAQAKDVGYMAEQGLRQRSNQTRMNELQQQWNQLILDVGAPLLKNVIEPMMNLAVEILPKMVTFVKENSVLLQSFGVIAIGIAAVMGVFVAKFILIGSLLTGLCIGAAKLSELLGEWSISVEKFGKNLKDSIVNSITDVINWMWEKFSSFISWLWDTSGLLGRSPSKIGLAMVDGIVSIGKTLLSALTTPFTSAFTFITELFGKIPEFITGVFKRGFDFVTKLPGMGLLTKAVDAFSGNKPTTINQKSDVVQSKQDDTDRLILEKLTELTNLLKSGAIAVNLDGRKVSETLAYVSSR
jgi:hypothetical protein